MQSSAMVALRTMIMITCLVAVPLAAVMGTALPKVVKSALDGRDSSFFSRDGVTSDEPRPPVTQSVLAADDSTETAVPAPSGHELAAADEPRPPTAHIIGVRPIDDEPAQAATKEVVVQTAPLWNRSPRTASSPRNRDTTAHFAPSPRLHGRTAAPRRRGEPRSEGLQKTVYSPPDEDESEAQSPGADGDDDRMVPVERPAGENSFAESERRLRELGAIYYRLESWGADAEFYRCSCSVALSPRSRATRHFEAIDAAPSQAIDAVIKQVDAWRAIRR